MGKRVLKQLCLFSFFIAFVSPLAAAVFLCHSPRAVPHHLCTARLPTFNVTGNFSICAGSAATLEASGADSYTWSTGQTTASISVSPTITTGYSVTLQSPEGTFTLAVTVSVVTVPSASLGFSYRPICLSDTIAEPRLDPGFTSGGSFTSVPGLSLNYTDGSIDPSQSLPGAYTITYSLQAVGCPFAGTSTATVIVDAAPVLTISPDLVISPGSGSVISVSGGSWYAWTPAIGLSCADCANPLAAPEQNMQYCVEARNSACATRSCVNVFVECQLGDFSLPNAFTPNGDGSNDEFCLQGWDKCMKHFNVLIFDRWGEKVFESNSPHFCWDGKYKGLALETDVLVFSLVAVFTDGSSLSKKGTISLIR